MHKMSASARLLAKSTETLGILEGPQTNQTFRKDKFAYEKQRGINNTYIL